MPRRRIPPISPPRRLDRRRQRGNATDAQRPARRGRRGQVETIAERRVRALELRKSGASFREIARQLGADLHTVHGDIQAELATLRETTVGHAEELRALELERCDQMVAGLWPKIQGGNPPAVLAAVRVSERRSRLLGLDEPTATRTEISGTLSVYAERLAAERELFLKLSVEQMKELAGDSQALVDKMMAMVNANASTTKMLVGVSPSPDGVETVTTGEPAEDSTALTAADQRRAETPADTAPRETP